MSAALLSHTLVQRLVDPYYAFFLCVLDYDKLMMGPNSFPFVVVSGIGVPKDPALRTLRRKQAMKKIAQERRERGKNGKVNQQESIIDEDEASNHTATDSSSTTYPDQTGARPADAISTCTCSGSTCVEFANWTTSDEVACWDSCSIDSYWSKEDIAAAFLSIIPNPLSAYEGVCMKYNVDLQNLSELTGFRVTQVAVVKLANLDVLNTLLGHTHSKYLEYVPSRCDSSKCIAAAVDYILASLHAEPMHRALETRSRR